MIKILDLFSNFSIYLYTLILKIHSIYISFIISNPINFSLFSHFFHPMHFQIIIQNLQFLNFSKLKISLDLNIHLIIIFTHHLNISILTHLYDFYSLLTIISIFNTILIFSYFKY